MRPDGFRARDFVAPRNDGERSSVIVSREVELSRRQAVSPLES
jgi:hypothetical protein